MEEPIFATNAADTARVTVILRFIIVVEEIANKACVLSETNAALLAICLDFLTSVTFGTDKLLQLLSIKRVAL